MHQLNNSNKFARVSVWNGLVQVHIRTYFKLEGSDDWVPTKKGVALSVDEWCALKSMIDIIDTELDCVVEEENEKTTNRKPLTQADQRPSLYNRRRMQTCDEKSQDVPYLHLNTGGTKTCDDRPRQVQRPTGVMPTFNKRSYDCI